MSILSSNLDSYNQYEPNVKADTNGHGPHDLTKNFIRKYYGRNASDIRALVGTPALALEGLNSDSQPQGRSNNADRITRFDPQHRYLGFLKEVGDSTVDAHFVFNKQGSAINVPTDSPWFLSTPKTDGKLKEDKDSRAADISTDDDVHTGPQKAGGNFPRITISLGQAIVNRSVSARTGKASGNRL